MRKLDARRANSLSALYVRHSADFLTLTIQKFGLSVEEVAIVFLILAENSRNAKRMDIELDDLNGENAAVSPSRAPPVTLKFIYSSLRINRETARRRLNALSEKGLVLKKNGGYVVYGTNSLVLDILSYSSFALSRLLNDLDLPE